MCCKSERSSRQIWSKASGDRDPADERGQRQCAAARRVRHQDPRRLRHCTPAIVPKHDVAELIAHKRDQAERVGDGGERANPGATSERSLDNRRDLLGAQRRHGSKRAPIRAHDRRRGLIGTRG
jgi:hypothetical protein